MISAVGLGRGRGARVVSGSSVDVVVLTVGGLRRVGLVSGTRAGVVGFREVVGKTVSSEDSATGVVVGRRLITVVRRTVVEVVVVGFLVVVVVVVAAAVVVADVVGLRVTNDHEVLFRRISGKVVIITFGVVVCTVGFLVLFLLTGGGGGFLVLVGFVVVVLGGVLRVVVLVVVRRLGSTVVSVGFLLL